MTNLSTNAEIERQEEKGDRKKGKAPVKRLEIHRWRSEGSNHSRRANIRFPPSPAGNFWPKADGLLWGAQR